MSKLIEGRVFSGEEYRKRFVGDFDNLRSYVIDKGFNREFIAAVIDAKIFDIDGPIQIEFQGAQTPDSDLINSPIEFNKKDRWVSVSRKDIEGLSADLIYCLCISFWSKLPDGAKTVSPFFTKLCGYCISYFEWDGEDIDVPGEEVLDNENLISIEDD